MRAKKRFGQNFLNDAGIIQQIVNAIHPTNNDKLVEIGPGQGALTKPVLLRATKLTAIELDREAIPILTNLCQNLGDLTLIQQDVLTVDFSSLSPDKKSIRLFGNLPYNISTPILFHLFEQIDFFQDMHFMLQKEVVDRMVAPAGSRTYGRLSVMVQYYCKATPLFGVPPHAFNPKPKVDSAIVRLIPHETRELVKSQEIKLEEIVKQAFSQRRKTLKNTLKEHVTESQWEKIGIDPNRRAETLNVQDFITITQEVTQ